MRNRMSSKMSGKMRSRKGVKRVAEYGAETGVK